MSLSFFDDRRLARDVHAAASRDGGADDIGAAISRVLAPIVAHDGLSLLGTDPATGLALGSFSFWHQYDPDLVGALVMHQYLAGAPQRPAAPAASSSPAVVVGTETDGSADPGLREILTAHGAGSGLRLLLRDRHGLWGALGLLRCEGVAPFDQDDARRAARLVPALVAALRRYATAGPLCPEVPPLPAGVITIGPDHRIKAVSPQAHRWLDRWSTRTIPSWTPNTLFVSLSLAARTAARRQDTSIPLICAPPAVCGRWITCQSQALDADATGDVALVIQGATWDLVLPSLCEWYGITPRERDVVTQLRTGASVKQIARRLDLSAHTVNDHLKAVFRKTGADGRDELVAAITR
ncbi:helix-turn-helix transcriptional regulator [Embleya hyalina]|uniref:Helix-turn-helix transcriptional regulator n=1 Tax=Embleya hyalina TaxID=516124 RepID=A0A401Z558_9ACTN|nr:helix-turn-helix transcriptional regulator [Embleya hyalina]GCE02002.1 helix-turn-helix transcriptional regulator [Embleya hyalina]